MPVQLSVSSPHSLLLTHVLWTPSSLLMAGCHYGNFSRAASTLGQSWTFFFHNIHTDCHRLLTQASGESSSKVGIQSVRHCPCHYTVLCLGALTCWCTILGPGVFPWDLFPAAGGQTTSRSSVIDSCVQERKVLSNNFLNSLPTTAEGGCCPFSTGRVELITELVAAWWNSEDFHGRCVTEWRGNSPFQLPILCFQGTADGRRLSL